MARGGRRTGTVGKSYSNRLDLNPAHKLPVTTATGQGYGVAKQQAAAQAAVPEASGQLGGPDLTAAAQSQAQTFQPPAVIPGSAPSMRPNEPVTTPPSAPIPGPDDPLLSGVALLNSLGDAASPEVKALRNVVSAQQANAAAP